MNLRAAACLMAAMILVGAGCKEDDAAVDTPYVEIFAGTYMVRDVTQVMDMAKIDSVVFTITDGITYDMNFDLVRSTDQVIDFCDHQGRLDAYTSNTMDFDPVIFLESNCDTLRIPRGEFETDYRSHPPDTIYIKKEVGDSLWQMVVLPQ